jgi:enoyl-CoA hydratase
MADHVSVERKDRVAVITINRPPVNAFTHDLMHALADTLGSLADDPAVSVAVLRSGVPNYFSAGMDLKAMNADIDPLGVNMPGDQRRKLRNTNWAILECPLPIIAAVNGFAVGMGFIVPALCDLIVAGRSSSFGMPEVRFALGGAGQMSRILPPPVVRYLMLTGERISADDLARYGAAIVVDDDQVDVEAERLASRMAEEIHPQLLRNLKLSVEQLKDVDDLRYRYALEHAWGGYVREQLGDAASSDDWLQRLKSK